MKKKIAKDIRITNTYSVDVVRGLVGERDVNVETKFRIIKLKPKDHRDD